MNTGVGNFSEFSDGTILVQDEVVFDKEKKRLKKIKAKYDIESIINIARKNASDIRHNFIWKIIQNSDRTIKLYQVDENKQQNLFATLSVIPDIGLLQDMVLLGNQLICSFQSGLYHVDLKDKALKKLANQTKKNPFKITVLKCGWSAHRRRRSTRGCFDRKG